MKRCQFLIAFSLSLAFVQAGFAAGNYSGSATGVQIDNAIAAVRNIKDYGAKVDEKFLADGVSTASSATFTSASASFVAGDAGKNISIAGAGAALSVPDAPTLTNHCTAAGTETCSATIRYIVTAVGASGETTGSSVATQAGAPDSMAYTAYTDGQPNAQSFTNYITVAIAPVAGAVGYRIYRSSDGTNYYRLNYHYPTSKDQFSVTPILEAAGNLTVDDFSYALINEAIPVSNTAKAWHHTTIASVGSGTTVTLTDAAASSGSSLVFNYGTDDTDAVNAALAALYAAGGGTLTVPVGTARIEGQILIPNDDGTKFTTYAWQPNITIVGTAGGSTTTPNQQPSNAASLTGNGSALDLRFGTTTWDTTNCPAKICTTGAGKLVIRDLDLIDRGYDAAAFLFVSNTGLVLDNVYISGVNDKGAAVNDAILLGGSAGTMGKTYTSAFYGFETTIRGVFANSIRRFMVAQDFTNAIKVENNTIDLTCSHPKGGVFKFVCSGNSSCMGNGFRDNYYEASGYRFIFETAYFTANTLFNNLAYEAARGTAQKAFISKTTSYGNVLISSWILPATGLTYEVEENAGTQSDLILLPVAGTAATSRAGIKSPLIDLYQEDATIPAFNMRLASSAQSFYAPLQNFFRSRGTFAAPLGTDGNDWLGGSQFWAYESGYGPVTGLSEYVNQYGTISAGHQVNMRKIWAFSDKEGAGSVFSPTFWSSGDVDLDGYPSPYTHLGGTMRANFYNTKLGSAVSSATSITPPAGVFHVTGTTTIQTITAPTVAGGSGRYFGTTANTATQITIIPDEVFSTGTSGNIALATTAVINKALIMTYDSETAKWYPSY